MKVKERVRLEKRDLFTITKSVWQGVKSRFGKTFSREAKKAKADAVANFYYQFRYSDSNEQDIVDLSYGAYTELLYGIETLAPILATDEARILDLGCGSLSFLRYLENRLKLQPKNYIGVDLYIDQREREFIKNRSFSLIESDIQSFNSSETDWNVTFACNSLVYCDDIKAMLERLSHPVGKSTKYIIIADPVKSVFWESYFNSIHLRFRNPSDIKEMLTQLGWQSISWRELVVLPTWLPLNWCVAYLLVMKLPATSE